MTKLLHIHPAGSKMIERYLKLNLGNKKVVCPYYINIHKAKDLRAMVGKGTPDEIEMEAKIWEKLKGANFDSMSEKEIRDFLMDRGIGIDCSGFALHVLNEIYKEEKRKSIFRQIDIKPKTWRRKLGYFLRPVENIGADKLTNEDNTIKIMINDVKPGDLIRSKWKRKNSHHVMVVFEVEIDDKEVKRIKYVSSAENYGDENGIRFGEIFITNPNEPLERQKWIDNDKNGVNHIFEGYLFEVEDNGLRRLKAFI